MVAGRVATLAIMCCGLLWIPVVPHLSKHLYVYLQSVQGCLSPPIVVVFVFGIFSTFTNGQGAFACLVPSPQREPLGALILFSHSH